MKILASQKIARHKRDMKTEKSKSLPVFFNRCQLASALGIPVRRLYEKDIPAQAADAKGSPLFRADRLEAIAQLLRKPEVAS